MRACIGTVARMPSRAASAALRDGRAPRRRRPAAPARTPRAPARRRRRSSCRPPPPRPVPGCRRGPRAAPSAGPRRRSDSASPSASPALRSTVPNSGPAAPPTRRSGWPRPGQAARPAGSRRSRRGRHGGREPAVHVHAVVGVADRGVELGQEVPVGCDLVGASANPAPDRGRRRTRRTPSHARRRPVRSPPSTIEPPPGRVNFHLRSVRRYRTMFVMVDRLRRYVRHY